MLYKCERVTDKYLLKKFINLPFVIYQKNNYWISPISAETMKLLSEKNPYFKNAEIELFVTLDDKGEATTRGSVVTNKNYEKKYGKKIGLWGFFECINDLRAAETLFESIFQFCQNKKIDFIEGPFNPNHYSELGLLANCYNQPPSFFQTYNHEYYHSLLTENGFVVSKKLHTRRRENIGEYLNTAYPGQHTTECDELRIRSFNLKKKNEDLEHLRSIFNDAFSDNWYFIPVSKEEYLFSSKYLNLVTPPHYIKFCECKGELVGAIHFVLDINPLLKSFMGKRKLLPYLHLMRQKNKINNAIIFAVGIKKAFQHSQVYRLLLNACIEIGKNLDTLETTWMTADNKLAIRSAERMGLTPHKEFLIYKKQIMP